MRHSPTLLRKRCETYACLRLLHLVTNQSRRRRRGKGRLKTIRRHLRDGVAEIEPKADLVLREGVHLVPRHPVKMRRFVIGEEVLHFELERFRAVIEGEVDDVTNLELLVAVGGSIRSLRAIAASLGQLDVLVLRVISATQALIVELLDGRAIGTKQVRHPLRGTMCVADAV